MQFLLQYWYDPSTQPSEDSPEAACEFKAWMDFAKDMSEAGVSVLGAPLQPPETATSLRTSNGKTTTVDGPFAETKEVLGGFDVIEVAGLDEALHWARQVPGDGTVEVRPILDLSELG